MDEYQFIDKKVNKHLFRDKSQLIFHEYIFAFGHIISNRRIIMTIKTGHIEMLMFCSLPKWLKIKNEKNRTAAVKKQVFEKNEFLSISKPIFFYSIGVNIYCFFRSPQEIVRVTFFV